MATKVIQMMEKTLEGYDELIPVGGGGIVIRVISMAGATVTCSLNGREQSYTFVSNGSHDFYGMGYGVYTITATDGENTRTITKEIKESKLYEETIFPLSSILNECSWGQISGASLKGTAQNIWSLGDIKMIAINGTITNTPFNVSYGVFIASFSHNPDIEGNGILFHSFKNSLTNKTDIALWAQFKMNTSQITNGGWRDCYMRSTIIPQFENAIPSDLKNVVKTSTIYSHNYTGGSRNDNASYVTATQDKFYLLAEFEIFGTRYSANSYEQNYQVQVEYYKLGNSKLKYQSTSQSTACSWWERSVFCGNDSNTISFNVVFAQVSIPGTVGPSGSVANTNEGFAVAFRV